MRFSTTASCPSAPCAAVGCEADNRGRQLRTRDASHEFPAGGSDSGERMSGRNARRGWTREEAYVARGRPHR
jgi:hypothetical protein